MLHLKDVSLNYKIPLRVAALVISTASLLASVLVYRSVNDLRDTMMLNAESIGRILDNTLVEPLLHDDVWRAFEIIKSPFVASARQATLQGAEYTLVLDAHNRTYVSTLPERFPILGDPLAADAELGELLPVITKNGHAPLLVVHTSHSGRFFLIADIQSDGVHLGTLLMSYSREPFDQRFYSLIRSAMLITLLVLAVLLPLGIYWGRRMADPLLHLSQAMNRSGPALPDPDELSVEESHDEIGQLAKSFKTMLAELKEKEQLQQQVIAADRLAAIGRLSAGIAHEINNPLGGMLNAISTFKRHGAQDPLTQKTLSLLERGLLQIKETVAALLVEAKAQTRPFDLNDVADICTLIHPDVEKKPVHFTRQIDIADAQTVPSTLARQVIINLLLNAIQATPAHGHIHLHLYGDAQSLFIVVQNNGSYIPPERVAFLFEPFTSLSENGNGLGLWVIYQIVQQLGGLITVQSEPDNTQFTVQLPLEKIT
ncbi:sensor histidine kinase [Ferrigenium sp. UT5]|uniref:sensor histidine kinase n=1 Tax=Ferrigenium sp. UT5 TaxID=3242105 RepID=UPI00354AF171